MKGEELYKAYCDVHAEKTRKYDQVNSRHFQEETALAWPYLNRKERDIWDEVGSRLGDRRVRKVGR